MRAMETLLDLDADVDVDNAVLLETLETERGLDVRSSMRKGEAAGVTRRHLLGAKKERKWVIGNKCWWSPKGTGCKEYYASFTLPDGTVVPGGDASSGAAEGSEEPRNTTVGT